ncbi:MAG TPA: FAD binding domain-containing protein [Acidimicrobiia bacterium]|nr:FAD binding domain-containing protein [Acidimicrobiia bacterium]
METILPGDLDAALEAVASPGATLLAGGTDLMVRINLQGHRPERVIALRRVEALRQWEGRFIGAGVTHRRLERGPLRALAEAARTVGSPQIRNAGTIGGNVGTASPAGDTLPFLAAVDATVVVRSLRGERELRWDEFFTGPKRTALAPDELILGIRLPEDVPTRQAFAKVGVRNAMVIAIASCCVVRSEDGATRVALGSVGPTPIRARRAEEMISAERRPSPAARAEFARLVAEEIKPITDHRSTAEFRRHAAGVLAARLLDRVAS